MLYDEYSLHDREDIIIYKDQGYMAPTFNQFTIGIIGIGYWCGIKDLLHKKEEYSFTAE